MTTLDFDRDHKIDFLATHLDRPTALLRNSTNASNHWIEVEVVGVACERDAIGTLVTCETKEGRSVAAINAGDGYVCSSQRLIHLGLGSSNVLDRLSIRWPDGSEQSWEKIAVDHRYQVVQGFEPVLSP